MEKALYKCTTLLYFNVIILLKSLAFKTISVTKSVLVLFSTFSNAHRPEKALYFDTVQSTWPLSWISKKALHITPLMSQITCKVNY